MNRAVYNNEPVEVTKNDVLCGRSPEEQCHPGNIRLKNCIELHRVKYSEANKANKSKIIRQIVDVIGGRFLKKNKDGDYVVIPPRGAREKVGLAMREALEPNKTTTSSSTSKGSSGGPPRNKAPAPSQTKVSAVAPSFPRNVSVPALDMLSMSAFEPTPINVSFEFNQATAATQEHEEAATAETPTRVVSRQSSSSEAFDHQGSASSIPEEVIARAAADLVCESDLSEFLSSLDDVFLMDTSVPLI